MKEDVVLQIFRSGPGIFGGRILRNGVEDGRVDGCHSHAEVRGQAADAGIRLDRVEVLDHMPAKPTPGTRR